LLVVLADAYVVAVGIAVNVYMSHFPGNLHSHHNIAEKAAMGVAPSSPIQEQRQQQMTAEKFLLGCSQ